MFDEAAKHYRSSLKYNPYLWSSFEALCHLGVYVVCIVIMVIVHVLVWR